MILASQMGTKSAEKKFVGVLGDKTDLNVVTWFAFLNFDPGIY